jgi:membrane associated rhomboid family serine protease
LVCLAVFANARSAHDAGTVVLSMREWYIVLPVDSGMGLYVRSAVADTAARLMGRTVQDNSGWPAAPAEPPAHAFPLSPWHALPVPILLSFCYWFSNTADGEWLRDWGRFDSARMAAEGEWWRLVTPLLLHGDIAHLTGNIAAGLIFGMLLGQRVGMFRVYVGAILTGALGNFANFLTFGSSGHLSIGASTAVFGLLGGLLGTRLADIYHSHGDSRQNLVRRSLIIPIGAGLALLGLLGAGGLQTDVLAHLYGFAAGVVVFALCIPKGFEGRN